MSESMTEKTIVFPESGGNAMCAGLMSMLGQQKSIDPMAMLAMAGGNGFGGLGGNNGILALLIVLGLFGGGFGGFGGFGRGFGNMMNTDADTMRLVNLINNNDGRSQIMSALNGNGNAISNLAQTLNCSTAQITAAVNSVASLIQGVGNQVGMTGQQVINAINSGDASVISQLQSCCCNIGGKITEQGYQNQLANCNQTNAITNAINNGVQSLSAGSDVRHHEIMEKLDNMERTALHDKIDALQETNSTLRGQISTERQTNNIQSYIAQVFTPLSQELGVIKQELNSIRNAQPPVATVPYSPVVGVPAGVAYQAGIVGGNGAGGSFWY